jgi:hypothetical protein
MFYPGVKRHYTPKANLDPTMSVVELKKVVDKSTPEERLFLEAYLLHLRRRDDPANAADLSKRMSEMDQGKKITLAKVKKLHQALVKQGL